jgi:hypothetical protein
MRTFANKRRLAKEEALLFPNAVTLKRHLEACHSSGGK